MYSLENGTEWTNDLKDAFKNGITRASVIYNNQDYNEDNYLKEAELQDIRYVPNAGIIGQAVARMLTVKMVNDDSSNLNFENADVEFKIGAEYANSIYYINYGNFIVSEPPENDDTNGTVKFIAYDYMIKFNQDYETRNIYPCTLKELLLDICDQAGVVLGSTSFPNENFVVVNNQFEGKQLRDVLQNIAKCAFSWARIGQDNKLYLDFEVDDTISETITPDDYKLDSFKKANEFYGPINKVTYADSDIKGQEVSVQDNDSIALNGLKELIIYDNYFAYTTEKRQELIQAGTALFGLTYMPIQELEMIGLVYLDSTDILGIEDGAENTFLTRNLYHVIKYNGTTGDSIEATGESDNEQIYANVNNSVAQNSRTEIIVDRAKKQISSIVEEVNGQNTKIAQISQKVDEIDSRISDLSDITVYGESNNAVVSLEGINESAPITLKVHPTVDSISYLYPSKNLYPEDLKYLKERKIRFKRTYEENNETLTQNIDYELPGDLLIYDSDTYDEFYLDYDSQTCQITKRCQYFGGTGTNKFDPTYMAGSFSNITSASRSQDEIFTIVPSASSCSISSNKQFVLTSSTYYSLSFVNLKNITSDKIRTTVTYYNASSTVVATETSTGNILISPGTNRVYFSLTFNFLNRTAGESFEFSVMLNLGRNVLTYETYNTVIKPLDEEEAIPYEYPSTFLYDGDYEVSILGYNYGYLFVRLMVQNIYTTQFATKAEVTSEINQKAGEITSTVATTYATKGELTTATTEIRQTTDSISATVTNNNTKANIVAKINDNTSQVKIDSDVIDLSANDVINLIAGNQINLTSKNITIASNNFSVDASGNITANSGQIGGWTINAGKIAAGDGATIKTAVVQAPASNTNWVFAAGGSSHSSYSDCPFRVDKLGNLYSTSATISGNITATTGKIAGFNISGNKLVGNNVGMSGLTGDDWAFWAGASTGGDAPFHVGHTGALHATNATISGTINATNGTFQNCTITNTCTVPASTVNGALATNNIPTISANKLSGGTINSSTIALKNTTLGTNSSTIGSFTANTSNLESTTANGNIGIGLNLYGNTPAFYVESAGTGDQWAVINAPNGGMATGGWHNASLKKYKKDFEKLENGLDIIKSIDIYKYRLKKERKTSKKRIGLVIDKDYKYSKEITNNKNNAVDLYSFVSVCCKAIQEQQEQIEQMKKEIETLKGGNK